MTPLKHFDSCAKVHMDETEIRMLKIMRKTAQSSLAHFDMPTGLISSHNRQKNIHIVIVIQTFLARNDNLLLLR